MELEKKVFEEVGGFRDIDHIASGDDMLLLQKIKRTYNNGIFYLKSKTVIVAPTVRAVIFAYMVSMKMAMLYLTKAGMTLIQISMMVLHQWDQVQMIGRNL